MPTNSQHGKDTSLRGGKGNFANDPQRASEAGRKGGQHSHMKSDSQGRDSSKSSSRSASSQSRRSSSTDDMESDEE